MWEELKLIRLIAHILVYSVYKFELLTLSGTQNKRKKSDKSTRELL